MYAIKNSTTIILPRWYAVLDELELKGCMMPRDVATRWNSTYDMLEFALAFREALDTITGDKEMKLRKYEMDDDEWEIACQLGEVLIVSLSLVSPHLFRFECHPLGLQGCNFIFLARWNPEPGYCNSRYGPH